MWDENISQWRESVKFSSSTPTQLQFACGKTGFSLFLQLIFWFFSHTTDSDKIQLLALDKLLSADIFWAFSSLNCTEISSFESNKHGFVAIQAKENTKEIHWFQLNCAKRFSLPNSMLKVCDYLSRIIILYAGLFNTSSRVELFSFNFLSQLSLIPRDSYFSSWYNTQQSFSRLLRSSLKHT